MEKSSYKQLVAQLEGLSEEQVGELAEALRQRQQGHGVQRLVAARLAEHGACPHCGCAEVVKHGFAHGTQRLRCRGCSKTFNALTGTPFNRLRGKEKFLENAACLADGLSISKTAQRLGFSVDKTFRWRHKFLTFLSAQKPQGMTGVVEADETFFPVSYKGQRKDVPRSPKKRGGKLKNGEGAEKVAVLVALQRGTRTVFDQILPSTKAPDLSAALRPALGADAVLSTDGNASYWGVAKELNVQSGFFVSAYHGKGGNGTWHVQGVNRYDSSLKSWMARFHGVATKYLANYLGWRRLLDRFQDNLTSQQFLFHALRTSYSGGGFNT